MRLRIVYEIETSSVQENCPGAIENVLTMEINEDGFTTWSATCSEISLDFTTLQEDVFFYIDQSELTFEFIQLRRWLVSDVQCR